METFDSIIKHIALKQAIGDLIIENAEQESIIESLKISLAEKERIIGKIISELLALKGCGGLG